MVALVNPKEAATAETNVQARTVFTANTRNRYFDISEDDIIILFEQTIFLDQCSIRDYSYGISLLQKTYHTNQNEQKIILIISLVIILQLSETSAADTMVSIYFPVSFPFPGINLTFIVSPISST